MSTDDRMCVLFPNTWEDPVCKAGADVAGATFENGICTEEYSENCMILKEYMEEGIKLGSQKGGSM